VSVKELGALTDPAQAGTFSGPERAALSYAEAMAIGSSVPGHVYKTVQQHFSADQIVELTAVIAWEICAAKFNRALEIEGQGICAVEPARG
jgi:alkylhydroperoxidase family enzyme